MCLGKLNRSVLRISYSDRSQKRLGLGGTPVGTGNLGDPVGVDLSFLAGDQFFEIPVPLVLPQVIAIDVLPDIDELSITFTSTPGASYIVETSTDLAEWDEYSDDFGASDGDTTTLTISPVPFTDGSKLHVRLAPN